MLRFSNYSFHLLSHSRALQLSKTPFGLFLSLLLPPPPKPPGTRPMTSPKVFLYSQLSLDTEFGSSCFPFPPKFSTITHYLAPQSRAIFSFLNEQRHRTVQELVTSAVVKEMSAPSDVDGDVVKTLSVGLSHPPVFRWAYLRF